MPFELAATAVLSVLMIAGLLIRPWRLPEAVWAVAAAAALVVLRIVPLRAALAAVAQGSDVYLFLAGMMLLAELGRREAVFDWIAARAAARARGSPARLFTLIYLSAVVVTVLLSNDATAMVLTPAVFAVTRAADVDPTPYLLICAFVANAASFVLPISNPANLVVFGAHLPGLWPWLRRFGVASLISILATYALLRFTQRRTLDGRAALPPASPPLSHTGRIGLAGLILAAAVILTASALGLRLGWPTFLAAAATLALIALVDRRATFPVVRHVSWSLLALVAGLFVWVEAWQRLGAIAMLSRMVRGSAANSLAATAAAVGLVTGIGANLINNLPAALIAGSALPHLSPTVAGGLLVGVDLGPNLSVTGSLATLLWLAALRREGVTISGRRFLGWGVFVMLPALLAALAALLLSARLL